MYMKMRSIYLSASYTNMNHRLLQAGN